MFTTLTTNRYRLSRNLFVLLATALVLSGCATYSVGVATVEQKTSDRNVAGALKSLDELKLTGADQMLYYLNKGTLLRLQGDYAASNQQFDSAKRLMESLSAISVTEQAGSVAVNDTLKAYEGVGHEQLLVYAFEELNYLQSGNIDEAAVEARQFDIKQRLVAGKNPSANYLSGAFVRYLNGMAYEEAGESDSARIDYSKAIEGYKAQSSAGGFGVPTALKSDLDRLENPHAVPRKSDTRNNGEVVFILHNGLGPSLAENIIRVPNPNPQHGTALLSVALPKFVQRPVSVARFELSEGSQSASSELVENVNAIAKKSLDDRLPAITARAVARLVVKDVAAKKIKKQSEDAGAAGMLIGMMSDVGAAVSERADTRSWSLLPGNILLARLSLPAGTHNLKVAFYGNNGSILATRDYNAVKVMAGHKAFVSDYYLKAN